MQAKALIVSLFLAATVAAAPVKEGSEGGKPDFPSNENSFNNIGNGIGKDTENNPTVGNDVGSHNGNNNGNDNGNNNGNGNTIGSNNQLTGDNEFLNDFLNVNYGATSRQISQEVVAAMKSLTLTCSPIGEGGVVSCKWQS
ncbi:hypothetical protein F5X98DRAFT_342821 [Xylaria grammica]|nr:hypothetical protein F5X98DRAFT_342821 [Xylaria grammica]